MVSYGVERVKKFKRLTLVQPKIHAALKSMFVYLIKWKFIHKFFIFHIKMIILTIESVSCKFIVNCIEMVFSAWYYRSSGGWVGYRVSWKALANRDDIQIAVSLRVYHIRFKSPLLTSKLDWFLLFCLTFLLHPVIFRDIYNIYHLIQFCGLGWYELFMVIIIQVTVVFSLRPLNILCKCFIRFLKYGFVGEEQEWKSKEKGRKLLCNVFHVYFFCVLWLH